MRKAGREAQKERLRAIYKTWGPRLMLDHWYLHLAYEDGEYRLSNGRKSRDALASCAARWEYRRMTITWNLKLVAQHDDKALERAFAHEVLHGIVHELRCARGKDFLAHEERVVTTLEWLLAQAYGVLS